MSALWLLTQENHPAHPLIATVSSLFLPPDLPYHDDLYPHKFWVEKKILPFLIYIVRDLVTVMRARTNVLMRTFWGLDEWHCVNSIKAKKKKKKKLTFCSSSYYHCLLHTDLCVTGSLSSCHTEEKKKKRNCVFKWCFILRASHLRTVGHLSKDLSSISSLLRRVYREKIGRQSIISKVSQAPLVK